MRRQALALGAFDEGRGAEIFEDDGVGPSLGEGLGIDQRGAFDGGKPTGAVVTRVAGHGREVNDADEARKGVRGRHRLLG